MKRVISNIAAGIWFFYPLMLMLLALPMVLVQLFNEIPTIMEYGFTMNTQGTVLLMVFGLIFGITMIVPAFRIWFRVLPWLYPYITILTADFAIIAIGIKILNYGYQVQSDTRHTLFFWLMIAQIVACRIAMSIFCHKKPMRIAREDYER